MPRVAVGLPHPSAHGRRLRRLFLETKALGSMPRVRGGYLPLFGAEPLLSPGDPVFVPNYDQSPFLRSPQDWWALAIGRNPRLGKVLSASSRWLRQGILARRAHRLEPPRNQTPPA